MANPFNSVLVERPKSSRFDLSHDVKTSTNFKKVIPIMCQETLPGDTWRLNTEIFLRTMPLVTPVMHNVDVFAYHFFVPNRIVWRNWDKFIKGGRDNKTEYQLPVFRVLPSEYNDIIAKAKKLGDYLGLPQFQVLNMDADYIDINALPFLGYRMIAENYFLDENFDDMIMEDLIDWLQDERNAVITSETEFLYKDIHGQAREIGLMRFLCDTVDRCWEHDYFTSSLPNTQRGDDVHLPLYGRAPLTFERNNGNATDVNVMDTTPAITGNFGVASQLSNNEGYVTVASHPSQLDVTKHTYVDLSAALGATINDFREALQLQRYNELVQRVGNRFKEWIRGIYGVRISDARIDIPEYLGGGRAPVMISEVLQNSQTTESSPQGNMTGKAVSASVFGSRKFFCEEHGFVFTLVSLRPRTAYMQGLPRVFTKFDRFDYGLPIFAHLGEQAVKAKEVYLSDDGRNDDTFGYLPRYSEYRSIPSQITGEMRLTLKDWHLGRYFSDRPVLNSDFVHLTNDDLNRIFAYTEDEDNIIIQALQHVNVRRPLPFYGEPI